jgi:hypothetical protein
MRFGLMKYLMSFMETLPRRLQDITNGEGNGTKH